MKLAATENLVEFCEKNSKEDSEITKPFTQTDRKKMAVFFEKIGQEYRNNNRDFKIDFIRERSWWHQKTAMSSVLSRVRPHYINETIHLVQSFPGELLRFISRYDTMCLLRITHPELFREKAKAGDKTRLDEFLATGQRRHPEISLQLYKSNLENPDESYDFCGPQFHVGHVNMERYIKNRYQCVTRLFKTKLNEKTQDRKIEEKELVISSIAERIASFSGC